MRYLLKSMLSGIIALYAISAGAADKEMTIGVHKKPHQPRL
jgi:hypothetical protein